MARGNVAALVGAQYGSEGKGVVAKEIAHKYDLHIRTGGANAGHSFVHEGVEYKMQCIPCGWVNPHAKLVIGAGGLVSPDIFKREAEAIMHAMGWTKEGLRKKLIVDAKAGVITKEMEDEEGGVNGELHKIIGSTGKGVGVARIAKIRRDGTFCQVADRRDFFEQYATVLDDTSEMICEEVSEGKNALLEGTQGSGLSLVHGPWPYVTSADTNAAQLAADAGVPPNWVNERILVARTYPIRVAGNSGPMQGELSWDDISQRVGEKTVERTTVTNKVRRIMQWDSVLFEKAVRLNDPTEIALTFVDYFDPKSKNVVRAVDLGEEAKNFIEYLRRMFDVRVRYVGTGYSTDTGWRFCELY